MLTVVPSGRAQRRDVDVVTVAVAMRHFAKATQWRSSFELMRTEAGRENAQGWPQRLAILG